MLHQFYSEMHAASTSLPYLYEANRNTLQASQEIFREENGFWITALDESRTAYSHILIEGMSSLATKLM